jgi:hypothetical protein
MFFLLATVGVLVCVAMLAAIVLLARGEPDSTPATPRLGGARRAFRLAGVAVGAAAVWYVGDIGSLGEGPLFVGPVFGLCALGGVLLGELLAPRPAGQVRVAGLSVRRIRDFAPRRGAAATALASGALIALAVTGTATAASAEQLRCIDGQSMVSPYPGWLYARSALLALAVGLGATLVVLRRIARRPWPAGEADDAAEAALRRRSAEAAVAGYGILVVTMVAGFAGATFGTTMNTGCPGVAAVDVLATALGFASLFGLLCLVVYLVRLVMPPTWSRA